MAGRTMSVAYAGIGSRATPADVLALMSEAAGVLAARGWVLRTGMAGGADQAFYAGAAGRGPVELFLPWRSFEASARRGAAGEVVFAEPSPQALELAAGFHPAWAQLSDAVRALHARNCHQVLGVDLNTPARFVLCWTPDGSLDGRSRRTGGTGQALRVARAHRVPVFNLARREHADRLRAMLVER